MLLTPGDSVYEHHGQAHGRGLRRAEAAGLRHEQVGAAHIQRHVRHKPLDMHVRAGEVRQLELFMQLLVGAADDGEHGLRREHVRKLGGKLRYRAAAHAAAGEQDMAALRRDAEAALRRRLIIRRVKRRAHREAGGNYFFPRNAAGGELIGQRRVRDEIVPQGGIRRAGGTGVVRADKGRGNGHGVLFQHIRQREGGENMRADDAVKAAAADVLVHPLRAGGEVLINGGVLLKWRGVRLHLSVAVFEKARKVPVYAHVPVADELGGGLGNEEERVRDLTLGAVRLKHLLYGHGAGVMPSAGVAAEDERAHQPFPPLPRRASSLCRRGRL